ncbi:hypothetical protein COCOBI_03-1510 [Coccomyxa sp. Obi]|nr:hypothetical protein COCOBI_03-1510 [Coccomyxa sp. Obi]
MVKSTNDKRSPTRSTSPLNLIQRPSSPVLSCRFLHLIVAANYILGSERTRLPRRRSTRAAEQVAVEAIMDLSDSANLSGDSSSEDGFSIEPAAEMPMYTPRPSSRRGRRQVENSKYADYDCSMK